MSVYYYLRTNYLADRWDELRRIAGLTADQVTERAGAIFDTLTAQGIAPHTIHHYRLDNPFMQEHARATMTARALREFAGHSKRHNL